MGKLCKFNVASFSGDRDYEKDRVLNIACPVSVFSAGRRNHSIHIVRSVTYLFQLLSHFRFKGTIFVLDTALPRVRFEIVSSQLLSPFFFSSSDFSRGDKQYSQQCWSVNRFYDDYGDNGYEKKKKKKKKFEEIPIRSE